MKKMNQLKYLSITIFLVFQSTLGISQTSKNTESGRILTIRFSSYTVEVDKLIQKEFSLKSDIKAIYSCIPAGLVVLESKAVVGVNEKNEVENRIRSINKNMNYEVLLGMSVFEVEENCAAKRKLED